jgi:hypothetical protein
MVVAAAILSPDPASLRVFGVELPILCTIRSVTGYPCPGCGLTRAIVWAAHGEFRASLASHPLGLPLLAWLLAEATRHTAWLAFEGRRAAIDAAGRRLDRAGLLFVPAFLIVWIWGLLQ